jgi:hypothetical protein
MNKPQPDEYDSYYERYTRLVAEGDLISTLGSQWSETRALLSSIPEQRGTYRYAPDKWSIKEVLGHMIDTERIMTYRALRIARGDTTPLPAFEQDDYARNAGSDGVKLASLIDEFDAVRRASILLFQHVSPDACTRCGTASGNPISVRALAWIVAGHELHHRQVLKDKYL